MPASPWSFTRLFVRACVCSRNFYDKRISQEVDGEVLGEDFKGYVFRCGICCGLATSPWPPPHALCAPSVVCSISGGNDKQGFPMQQGILVNNRVRLLMGKGTLSPVPPPHSPACAPGFLARRKLGGVRVGRDGCFWLRRVFGLPCDACFHPHARSRVLVCVCVYRFPVLPPPPHG